MRVTAEVKKRVEQKLHTCVETAQRLYPNDNIQYPNVVYRKRGTTAGTANDRSYTIDLNPILLMENQDEMVNNTVVHEFAHLVDGRANPHTRMTGWRGKRSLHGPTWKRIMVQLGVNPSRTHNMDVSTVRKSRNTAAKYVWKGTCGCTMEIGPKRHAKQVAHAPYYVKGHRRCTYTYLGREGQIPQYPTLDKSVTPSHPTLPTTTPKSKVARCEEIFLRNRSHFTDVEMKSLFVSQAGCTIKGSSTYLYNLKKKWK